MFDHNLRIKLTSLETKLDTMINTKIISAPSTEAKQDVIKLVLDTLGTEVTLSALETLLTSLDAKDYATQATLAALNTAFGNEDFSTEVTLSAILAKIITAPSTEAKQDLIKVVLDSLDAKDYATQTTLSALNTAFGTEDFSSEITLASVLTKLTELDNKIDAISNADNMNVTQVGNTVVEQLNETDAVTDVLTFSANIESVEIYHNEATSQDFIVNGLTLTINPKNWRSLIGGTPSAEVTIPTGVTCSVKRLV